MRSSRTFATTVALAAGAAALAACSSSGGSSTSPASTGSTGASSASSVQAVIAAAQAAVTQYSNPAATDIPKPPSTPYNPGKKKVMVISCGQAAAACAAESAAAVEAAKAIGWTVSPIEDSQLDATKVTGFINQAINEKYNAIIYASADPNSSATAANAAHAAGIVQVAFNNPIGSAVAKDGIISVTPDLAQRGKLIGDWIITKSQCKGDVVVFDDTAYQVSHLQIEGVKNEIAKCGAGLHIETTDIATDSLSQAGPPFWTAELAKHPAGKTLYAVTPYDSVAAPMAITAADQGRTDVQITGFDGAPQNVGLIKSGKQGASVTSPFGYLGYVSVDLAARKLAGQPLYPSTTYPARLVTKSNASSFPDFWTLEGFDYKSMFAKIWGRSA